jgi:hypothetical protein
VRAQLGDSEQTLLANTNIKMYFTRTRQTYHAFCYHFEIQVGLGIEYLLQSRPTTHVVARDRVDLGELGG